MFWAGKAVIETLVAAAEKKASRPAAMRRLKKGAWN
jgi:hypothetical protein